MNPLDTTKVHDVTLFVASGKELDGDWAHVESSTGRKIYRYRYEPPHGVVRVTVGEPRIVRVRLEAEEGLALHDLRVDTDPFLQLRVERVKCNGGVEFLIHNVNKRVQVAYYSILVSVGDDVLTCDPMIRNEPRP